MIGITLELAKQLYSPKVYEPGYLPYRVFASGGQTYGMDNVAHVPGLKGYTDLLPTQLPYHGYIGVTVENYAAPRDDQPVRFHWYGVDIDAEDNDDNLIEHVTDYYRKWKHMLIRTSKSGRGVHLIFKNQKYGLEPQMYNDVVKQAKHEAADECARLLQANIIPCVFGLVNMWLWSQDGKQETLYYSE